jgi:hypothetical protein
MSSNDNKLSSDSVMAPRERSLLKAVEEDPQWPRYLPIDNPTVNPIAER